MKAEEKHDIANLPDAAIIDGLENATPIPATAPTVPRSAPRGGTGNDSAKPVRERPGTVGTVPRFETMAAFMERTKDLPELTWLIDGLIPDIGQVWLIATGGSGKTWFALAAAKTAASAGRDVFLVEEEHAERGLHDRFANMAFSAEASARVRLLHRSGLKFGDAIFEALLAKVATAERPMIVVDCVAQVFRGNENDTQDANAFNEQLKRLVAAHAGALVLVLHHTSKGSERAENTVALAGRGSSAFNGAADVELRLRKESTEKGSGIVRFTVEPTKAREFELGARKRVTLTLGTGEATMDDAPLKPIEDKSELVLEALSEAEGPLSKSAIAKAVKHRKDDVTKAVDALVASGKVRKEGRGFVRAQRRGEPS